MTMVRPAQAVDIPIIARMGERFHAEAAWGDIAEFDRAHFEKTLAYLTESGDGILSAGAKALS